MNSRPADPRAHEPYSEASQQREADLFGMYVFLATEVMLFGGFLAAVYVIRIMHPQDAASAAGHLDLWLGTLNTSVLLTSSLAVAIAVSAARAGRGGATARWLLVAAGLGIVFLGIKAFEYSKEYRGGLMPFSGPSPVLNASGEQIFFNAYLVGTSLHALHLTLGICLVVWLALRIGARGMPLPRRSVTIEAAGLYWHLVDVVWVFIFPIFYLAR